MDDLKEDVSVRVAASVTLYNSQLDCLKAISTYKNQVERIYVIDNSEEPDIPLIRQLMRWPNVQYVSQGGNQGIGASLNKAAQLAISDGFDFLLTMDDDTFLPPNAVCKLLRVAVSSAALKRVGIVSGVHSTSKFIAPIQPVSYTMTSGNLLNLSIYKKVGPFREDFFIDHVDHEYGLRLNKANFQVVELPDLEIKHHLGERKTSGWGSHSYISHAPIRGYYIVRNGVVLAGLYPDFKRQALILSSKECLKALLFEAHKLERLRLLWRGLRDGWHERLGKYNE